MATAARTRTPRTGRRPGATSSREVILRVARAAFTERGYKMTSMRQVARDAGVDPALIVHFFGSKAGLFSASLDWPFDPEVELPMVMAAGRDQIGVRLARRVVAHWDEASLRSPMIALLAAAMADEVAARLLSDFMSSRLILPVVRYIEADRPELRSELVASQLLGMAMARYVLRYDALHRASSQQVVRAIAPTIQHYCTEPLGL
jgi:AcrR family transcriptional regulator